MQALNYHHGNIFARAKKARCLTGLVVMCHQASAVDFVAGRGENVGEAAILENATEAFAAHAYLNEVVARKGDAIRLHGLHLANANVGAD
jgi:hypothetical protein